MILEDLWSSRLYPAETVVPMSPKYREILEKMEHLQAQLPREQFTLVEQVLVNTPGGNRQLDRATPTP